MASSVTVSQTHLQDLTIVHAAAKETLSITIPNFVQAAVIQIVDNIIGLMMWDNFNHSKLFIWNWVTGSLVVVCPRCDSPPKSHSVT